MVVCNSAKAAGPSTTARVKRIHGLRLVHGMRRYLLALGKNKVSPPIL